MENENMENMENEQIESTLTESENQNESSEESMETLENDEETTEDMEETTEAEEQYQTIVYVGDDIDTNIEQLSVGSICLLGILLLVGIMAVGGYKLDV